MSGSGHQPESLTEKLLHEIRAAFSMIQKDFRQFKVDFRLDSNLTIFSSGFYCQASAMPLGISRASSYSGFTSLTGSGVSLALPLIHEAVASQEAGGCAFDVPVWETPVYHELKVPLYRVSFASMKVRKTRGVAITNYDARMFQWDTPWSQAPRTRLIPPVRFKTSHSSHQISTLRGRTQSCPKPLFGLPIIKVPIPLHRFSPETKAQFRKALAEKTGTHPSKMLITLVYDRITMSIFKSISQDERGVLVCYPKPEALGQTRRLGTASGTCYLVFGQRLDTKETVNALVPVDAAEGEA
jgi:hypothetical protein